MQVTSSKIVMASTQKDVELSQLNTCEKIPYDELLKNHNAKISHKIGDFVKRRLYILNWLPEYDRTKAIGDFISGVTIGLTMIPQSLAYANLANVPAIYGLYSAFMGSIVYIFLGTVKEVSIGPTSLMSIITVSYTYEKPIEYVFIMTFICGCVEMLMGIFKLGFLVDFISVPVVSAFSSSTAILVIVAQLKNLFGIKFKAKSLPLTIVRLAENINQIKIGDTALGLFAIAFLLSLKKLNELGTKSSNLKLKKFLFYFSLCRNALIVLITGFIAYSLSASNIELPFRLSEEVPAGIPSFQLPAFSATVNNETVEFDEIAMDIGSGFILLPLVSILANVAIAKAFTSGKIVDATQEMIALGMCNVLGSFFKSIPTCGAFTRSAVSNASGVQTPFAGIYSAIMALMALTLLTQYFNFIPKATLAAILICAVLSLIDIRIGSKLWNKSKIDFISWIGCIIACIAAGVEVGLLVGVALSMINIFLKAARPNVVIYVDKKKDEQIIYVRPSEGIFFPGIDSLREKINITLIKTDYKYPVVLDMIKISSVDYTALQGIDSIIKDLKKHNLTVTFANVDEKIQRRLNLIK
ncbi:sodium-independent sulfate anion transporter isoform X2 [Chironomus tepperi]|uniref:sodium-independent sulfate anion transporter isoform X2 n=1 Tax=Chironomus tepperi TaxID=113505 RepID=UPI00391FBA5C